MREQATMRKALIRYGIAVAASAVAAILVSRFGPLFGPWSAYPFAIAAGLCAAVLGLAPAVVALVLGNAAILWNLQLSDGLLPPSASDLARLLVFDAVSLLLIWAIDRSRRARLETEMVKSDAARTFDLIANTAPSMVWVSGTDGLCYYFNRAWLGFTGRTLEQEEGNGWTEGVHPDDFGRCLETYDAAFAARKPFRMEYRLRRHDGAYRWIDDQGVPRFSADGEFEGFIGSCIDIDETKAAVNEREALLARIESERERIRHIVSNVPGVVWEAWGQPDLSAQRVAFVSDHVERMLGYTVDEWMANPNFWLTIVHPDDREVAARNAAEHFAAGGTRTNSFRWLTKDGRAIHVEAHSTVITDERGRPIGMCGVTMDVSARRRAEESLEFLAKASDVLSSSLDYETTIATAVSLALPRLADMCIVDLVASDRKSIRRLASRHARPDRQALADAMKRHVPAPDGMTASSEAIRLGKPVVDNTVDSDDIAARIPDPEHAQLIRDLGVRSYLAVPMMARGRTLGALVFTSEQPGRYDELDVELAILVARRAAIAVDNAQLYQAALAANAAKDEFLTTVSHELRTPLTAALGWVRLLRTMDLDERTTNTALEAIEQSTRAQARLIDDILDASSIVHGKFRLVPEDVDLATVVESAMATLHPAILAKNMRVVIDRSRWSGTIQGDPARLQQVIWNLLSNALKFGRHGGCVTIAIERRKSAAVLTVSDDGPGVDSQFAPYVFDRFRQAESGTNRSFAGLGLGLAIVKNIVELHGGTVRLDDGADRSGATFVVELPILDAAPATGELPSNAPAANILSPT